MRAITNLKSAVTGLVGVALLVALTAAPASASLMIQVVLPGGGTVHPALNPGESVEMEIWAQIEPSDAGNALWSASSGFVSTGGALGTLEVLAYLGPFDASGSSLGGPFDLDGDGDMDVGGASPAVATGWFNARATGLTPGDMFQIGMLQFTMEAPGTGVTEVGAFIRENAAAGIWKEGAVIKNGLTGTMVAGPGVTIMPEPATMALLGLGGVVALLRRRRA